MRPDTRAATPRPDLSLRISALEAYRQSIAGSGREQPTEFYRTTIEIGSVLQAASELPHGAERDAIVESCVRQADDLLRPEGLVESMNEPSGISAQSWYTPLRGLVNVLYLRESWHLALHMLESLRRICADDPLERARLMSLRVSIAWFLGEDELAVAATRELASVAHRLRSDELKLHAWRLLSSVAKLRGNMPAQQRAVRRVVKYGERLGDRRSLSLSASEQAVLAGMRGDHSGAVILFWAALTLSDHPCLDDYALANAAHTLFQTGEYRAARAARAVVLSRPYEHAYVEVTIGGYAVACAGLRDLDGVRWASAQILARLQRHRRESRHVAQGLFGCADACGASGLSELASMLYGRAIEMADRRGYHDLRFRPDPNSRDNESFAHQPLSEDAKAAAVSFEELAPDGLPDTFELTGSIP